MTMPISARARRYGRGDCVLLTFVYAGRRAPRHVLVDRGEFAASLVVTRDIARETGGRLDVLITARAGETLRGLRAETTVSKARARALLKREFGVSLTDFELALPSQGLPFATAHGTAPSRFRWIMRQMDATHGQQIRTFELAFRLP
jgi:hypothetical protein